MGEAEEPQGWVRCDRTLSDLDLEFPDSVLDDAATHEHGHLEMEAEEVLWQVGFFPDADS